MVRVATVAFTMPLLPIRNVVESVYTVAVHAVGDTIS